MPTLLEQVKALTDQIPNLGELVAEATATKEQPVAETAYIYNGFTDLKLPYLGVYTYDLPRGKVTAIHAVEHQEVDQSKSFDGNTTMMAIHLPGESIARELIETRKFTQKGCAVFFDGPNMPKGLKEECDENGRRHILGEIEGFKVNREKAKAGTAGYKIKPDPAVYGWMEEYTPDDELFASQSAKTDQATQTANAINKLTEIAERLAQNQAVPAQVLAVATEEAVAEIADKGQKPRRNPLENAAAYKERTGFDLDR